MICQKRTLLLTAISLTAVSLFNCCVASILPTDIEQQAVRHCLTTCGGWKVDTSEWTMEVFLAMSCERNRMMKMELQCKKVKKPGSSSFNKQERIEDGSKFHNATHYLKDCLSQRQQISAFNYYSNIGKIANKAREFMKKEVLTEVLLPSPTIEPNITKNTSHIVRDIPEGKLDGQIQENFELETPIQTQPHNQNEENSIQQNENLQPEKDDSQKVDESSEEPNDNEDVSEISEYAIFSDGFCYTRYLLNPMVIPAEVSCVIPCMEKSFAATEEVLIHEMEKLSRYKYEQAYNFVPSSDIFEVVARLTAANTLEKLSKLGELWSTYYKSLYHEIEAPISYVQCTQQSCIPNAIIGTPELNPSDHLQESEADPDLKEEGESSAQAHKKFL